MRAVFVAILLVSAAVATPVGAAVVDPVDSDGDTVLLEYTPPGEHTVEDLATIYNQNLEAVPSWFRGALPAGDDAEVVVFVFENDSMDSTGDVDPFTEVGIAADEYVTVDLTPHIEPKVAVGLDIAFEADALTGDDGSTADTQLDGALSADEYVAVGNEVVFFDLRVVGDREFLERIRTEHGGSVGVAVIKTRLRRQTTV